MARWGWLQKGGLTRGQRPLKSNARKAWDEIRRACDVTDVLYLAGSNLGVGRHKLDLAVDMQAGRGNNGPHQKVADYVLANWNRLGIRYMAWNAHEYHQTMRGGPVPKPLRQTWRSWWNTSSDPEHRNHVHIDWWGNAPNGANPGIAIGAAFDDFKQGSSTATDPDELTEEEMKQLDQIVSDLGKIKAAIERLERQGERNEAIATENQKRITVTREVTKTLGSDSPKIKAAIERIERNTEEDA